MLGNDHVAVGVIIFCEQGSVDLPHHLVNGPNEVPLEDLRQRMKVYNIDTVVKISFVSFLN